MRRPEQYPTTRTPWISVALIALGILAACSVFEPTWEGSVGAVLRYNKETRVMTVDRMPPDGAAIKAGLKPGDQIIAINGQPVQNMSLDEILTGLRGPVGTKAKLTIARGSGTLDLEVERTPFEGRDKED